MHSRLAIRSSYSLLWGTRTPHDIVGYLKGQGYSAVGITDRNSLYGVHEFIAAARKADVQPIIGAELVTPQGSVFAFVSSKRGFSRLCTLLSEQEDIVKALQHDSDGLILATTQPQLLEQLARKGQSLYAAITSRSLRCLSTARRLQLPVAALDDATFLAAGEREVHAVLRAIALHKTVGTLTEEELESADALLLDRRSYEKAFASWPEAVQNSEIIASQCCKETFFDALVFPTYPVTDPARTLRERVLAGAEKRYGELSDAIVQRIEYELGVIERKGFSSYFLVMDDIVAIASRTCGRGSAASSIVSYALGITNVDPIAYNLYFERFLNPSRTDPPDIDVDFAWDERDDVIKRTIKRFGADRCARVANHNHFCARSALRETAKAYGLSESELVHRDPDDPLWRTIVRIAAQIETLPRSLSLHCGGLVITPGPIHHYAPIDTSTAGYPVLAWDKEGTEAAGLVKIDLLGNRSLAVIRDALANLEEQGIVLDTASWHPAQDPDTIDALARGDTMGVFYIESPAMRQLQRKTRKGDFAHIVIHSSIIRPAANKFINEYVRRLKGGAWTFLDPRLASILDETYGILCYQEDVSKTAVALARFSESEADALRKVIAKKAKGERLARYERQFIQGCRANGVEEPVIKEIWEMMVSFEGYSFCKAHSASYAMVSFQSAYLRVHYPAAFMAAVLSNGGGYYRAQAYISEARRMGLTIVGPDINRSRRRYYAEGSTVIVGFMAIANLSTEAIDTIGAERRQGLFLTLEETASRLSIQRDDWVALVAAGGCDSLAPGMARSEQLLHLLTTVQRDRQDRQKDLFIPASFHPLPFYHTQKRTESELRQEFDFLGFLREYHPLALWAKAITRLHRIKASELASFVGKRVTLVGWQVTSKTVLTKDERLMDFVSFEDETALYETILFPQIYERYRHVLGDKSPLVIYGTVQDDQGAISVEVAAIRRLEEKN